MSAEVPGDTPIEATPPEEQTAASPSRRFKSAPSVTGGTSRLPNLKHFGRMQWPSALMHVPFRRYWLSQIVALGGGWMQNVGMQLVVLSITTSAFAIGAINVVSALPMLFFSLYGGVLADRFDRRKIVIISLALLGGISAIYALLIGIDRLEYWHILVLAAAAGLIASFELPAQQAFVSELVPKRDLPQAIALNSASFNATRIVGPALAATAISIIGLAGAFVVNIFTLLAPMTTLIGLGKVVPKRERPKQSTSALTQLKDGMAYVTANEGTMGLVLLQALISFFVSPNLLVLMPLFTTNVLGGSNAWVGYMLSALGIGSLTGAIVLLRGRKVESAARRRMQIAMVGLVVGLSWLGLSTNVWMAVPGIMIAGFSFSMGNTQLATRLQQTAPDQLRGRVMSLNTLAFNGVMPFSTLLISWMVGVLGQKEVLVISGVLLGLGVVYLWKRYVHKAFDATIVPVIPERIAVAYPNLTFD
ncbi:MAG: MFS transporter [Thermomicrobiales bacterium]|nr:MFS transporter [Thermomicrobiales bacterium]MCO5227212.1 MFS transporter [Thermomicrobiales bacterium]